MSLSEQSCNAELQNSGGFSSNSCSSHPEKDWKRFKMAQSDSCACAALPAASHSAWDPWASLQSLKFAVQPGPEKQKSDGSFTSTLPGSADWPLLCTSIRRVLLMLVVVFFVGLGSLFPLPPAVFHAAPGASCRGPSHPEPANVEENTCPRPKSHNHLSLRLLPCSGFRLSCIVHLLLLPNVLLFLSIIKLLYPLFTAGFKGSSVSLKGGDDNTHTHA